MTQDREQQLAETVRQKLARVTDKATREAFFGGTRQTPTGTLRYSGGRFYPDDGGPRCTCGQWAIVHRSTCPLACVS